MTSKINTENLAESCELVEMSAEDFLLHFQNIMLGSVLPLLEQAIINEDTMRIESFCHGLSSHCRNIGLIECMEIARDAEISLKHKQTTHGIQLAKTLPQLIKRDFELLKATLSISV